MALALDNMVYLYDVTATRQDMGALSLLNHPAVARYPQLSSTLTRVLFARYPRQCGQTISDAK